TANVTSLLESSQGPIVAVTDYMRAVPDQIAPFVPRSFTTLGTDGYGRSDTRKALRSFFEVDADHLVIAVLSALAREGTMDTGTVTEAIERYGIDPNSAPSWLR
ncbi:MAG: pyruvate dehydrogenase (acetyl-transferring), homodimeric type, partial [Actinomycetia bacterium]|nr:pyruvate dehydrogenase (acetyl-transferring), homodimeric type [Actinomycetes bacterium]